MNQPYSFVDTMGLLSITRFNIRLTTFAKFKEFLKSSTVKTGFTLCSYFPALRHGYAMLNFYQISEYIYL